MTMSVLALINDKQAIDLVLPWAMTFAKAREGSLIVVCWTESAVLGIGDSEDANEANAQLVQAVREKMLDDSLVVEVHCVKELWQETSP